MYIYFYTNLFPLPLIALPTRLTFLSRVEPANINLTIIINSYIDNTHPTLARNPIDGSSP